MATFLPHRRRFLHTPLPKGFFLLRERSQDCTHGESGEGRKKIPVVALYYAGTHLDFTLRWKKKSVKEFPDPSPLLLSFHHEEFLFWRCEMKRADCSYSFSLGGWHSELARKRREEKTRNVMMATTVQYFKRGISPKKKQKNLFCYCKFANGILKREKNSPSNNIWSHVVNLFSISFPIIPKMLLLLPPSLPSPPFQMTSIPNSPPSIQNPSLLVRILRFSRRRRSEEKALNAPSHARILHGFTNVLLF